MNTSPSSSVPESLSYPVPEEASGWRLDKVLGLLAESSLPPFLAETLNAGLRARRRLCERGLVLVQGKPAQASLKVRAGQSVSFVLENSTASEQNAAIPASQDPPTVVLEQAGLAALSKPVGMHTVHLAGSGETSLESWLPTALAPCEDFVPRLLNRLDAGTSGLVLAAVSEEGERFWRRHERIGRIDKDYLAIVVGQPLYDFSVARKLDTDNRIRTRVLHTDIPDPARHTEVSILHRFTLAEAVALHPFLPASLHTDPMPLSLVSCRIHQGARHQIRAHLAAAGHPLLGDSLYGEPLPAFSHFFLHHHRVCFADFLVNLPPAWIGSWTL